MKALSNYSKLIAPAIALVLSVLAHFGLDGVASWITGVLVPALTMLGVYVAPANKPAG